MVTVLFYNYGTSISLQEFSFLIKRRFYLEERNVKRSIPFFNISCTKEKGRIEVFLNKLWNNPVIDRTFNRIRFPRLEASGF